MTYVIDNSDATCVIIDAEYAPMLADAAASCPKVRTWVAYTATEGAPPIPDGFTAWDDVVDGRSDQPPDVTSDLPTGRGDDLHVGHDRQAEGGDAHGQRPGARRSRCSPS